MKKAKWIWKSKEYSSDEYVAFFENLNYYEGKVFIDISVAGEYTLYINGEIAFFGQYADYPHYKVYDKIEITDFLVKGKNDIKLIVWHMGVDSFTGFEFGAGAIYEIYNESSVLSYSKAGACCGLYKGYINHKNKFITAQIGLSYIIDTRFEDLEEKVSAVEVDNLTYDLRLRPNKKLVFGEKIKGELINKDKRIYDLGKECCGFLFVELKGESGEKVYVKYGEHIRDGEVPSIIGARDFSVGVICNGKNTNAIGSFRRLGCRYLQVDTNNSTEIKSIGIIETLYPLNFIEYKTNNKLRQKIYDVSQRTLALCMHEHYEDCPWREQAMYLLDTRNQMLCGYYAYDNIEFQKSAIELFCEGQRESGLFDICFPAKCKFTIPSFSLMFPWIVLEYTQFVENTSLAEKIMPKIEKLLLYFTDKIDETGLFKTISAPDVWHFYEWAGDLDGNFFSEEAMKKRNGYDVIINAYIALALEKTAMLYGMMDKNARAEELRKIKDNINRVIFEQFFDKKVNLFKTYKDREEYSMLANALCILSGACPDLYKNEIAKKIANEDALLLKNTLSMNIFRFDALLSVNEEKYSKYIIEKIDELYGKMLGDGATSFWETEKGADDFDGAGSLCHGWSAIPIYYYNILCENGKVKSNFTKKYFLENNQRRNEYRDSVYAYIENNAKKALQERDEILRLSQSERREKFVKMLGKPLSDRDSDKLISVKIEHFLDSGDIRVECLTVNFSSGIKFGGLIYSLKDDNTENKALILCLHGGGGTPERIGGLFHTSANYNRMVRRTLKKGSIVFAPQLLLWHVETYKSEYDREFINKRLIQQGGSITALEVYFMMNCIDYFINNGIGSDGRIGVVGLSYGGMYALHLSAVDERIKSTISHCWFNDRAKQCWSDWTYFNAENLFFDSEVASLILPRKLYIGVGDKDMTFLTQDAEKESKRLIKFAEDMGYSSKLRFTIFDGGHEFNIKDDDINSLHEDLHL